MSGLWEVIEGFYRPVDILQGFNLKNLGLKFLIIDNYTHHCFDENSKSTYIIKESLFLEQCADST